MGDTYKSINISCLLIAAVMVLQAILVVQSEAVNAIRILSWWDNRHYVHIET